MLLVATGLCLVGACSLGPGDSSPADPPVTDANEPSTSTGSAVGGACTLTAGLNAPWSQPPAIEAFRSGLETHGFDVCTAASSDGRTFVAISLSNRTLAGQQLGKVATQFRAEHTGGNAIDWPGIEAYVDERVSSSTEGSTDGFQLMFHSEGVYGAIQWSGEQRPSLEHFEDLVRALIEYAR